MRNHLLVLHAYNYFNCFDLFEQCRLFLLHFVISFNHPGRIHGEGLITDIGAATARIARSAKMFFYVLFEKSIESRFQFQVYTRLNYLKFEIPKIFWGGAHRAPSPDPSPAHSRASPSNLGRFAPSIRASPDSDPQLLKRGCAPAARGLSIKYVTLPGDQRCVIVCDKGRGPVMHDVTLQKL